MSLNKPTIAEHEAWPVRAQQGESVLSTVQVTFGSSGAVSSQSNDPGLTMTKPAGTGVYSLAYPKSTRCQIVGHELIQAGASEDARNIVPDAAPSAGVITWQSIDTSAADANAVSGDILHITLLLRRVNAGT